MPKNPPDLARLLPSPTDRVQVQDTAFSYDVMGRYVCNDWAEVKASLTDGGFPFDVIVVGAGMFGGYFAEKLYRSGSSLDLRILVLDAGAFLFPTHIQNLPQRLGGSVGGPRYNRTREDGSLTQNVIWGMPWISNEPFPGLAYCIGGRSLFWGGWAPRLTAADLAAANWPADIETFLNQPAGDSAYERTEREIGVSPTTDFIADTPFHADLLAAFQAAVAGKPGLTGVEEAPLAVLGSAPDSGLFPFDKFSAAPFLIDAVRNDVANNTVEGDVSRRIFVVPRTQVLRLNRAGNTVTSLDVLTDGVADTMQIPSTCAVILANGTIEATRIALDSLGVGDMTFNSPRVGNLMAHVRSNIVVRIKRTALGLPAVPAPTLETTAFLVRGTSSTGRRFHLQVTAAAVGGIDPEKNLFQEVPDIDIVGQIRANQDPDWIAIVLRGIGEMEDSRALPPDPARSWIDLSSETDRGVRRAYVNVVLTANDKTLWDEMDAATFDLALTLAGGNAADIQYLQSRSGPFLPKKPNMGSTGQNFWNDGIGTTHHEAGTLFMGAPGTSITDTSGRFHGIDNAYVVGPAVFPTLGSANPSLTALSLARRTARAIVTDRTPTPPAGLTPLSLDPQDWQLVTRPGGNAAIQRIGPVLQTSGGYGLYYYTNAQFGDADLWVEWRELATSNNSGIYVRTPGPTGADPLTQADAVGHEIQIDDIGAGTPPGQPTHMTGAVYDLQGPTQFPALPAGQWNTYLIQLSGSNIKVTLNGVPVNNYTSSRARSGYLALQVHGSPSKIQFRNLRST